MAHTVKKTEKSDRPGSGIQGTLVTKEMVMNEIESRSSSTEFYELEPVEVLEVFIDEDMVDYPNTKEGGKDFSLINSIKGRFVLSEQNKSVDECGIFMPLNPNINTIPLRGEVVIGVRYLGQLYYTNILNCFGSPNANIRKNISSYRQKPDDIEPGEYFTKAGAETPVMGFSRKLRGNEGDLIIEGRYQQSIRLSSDQKDDGEKESPNIIISAGHLINGDSDGEQKHSPQKENPLGDGTREKAIFEDIDKDGSTIYLSTNEELKFTPAVESQIDGSVGPFEGKNILLDSDRIIFNTKNNGSIAMMSSHNIGLSAVNEVVIETPVSKLGSVDAEEPQVLGQVLVDKIQGLIDAIGLVVGIPTPTGPTPGPINSAPNWAAVDAAMAQVQQCLSTKHLIDS